MNTKDVGDRTVAMVMAALVKTGRVLLIPFGDNRRYDLAVDDGGRLVRIQCKTGRLIGGSVSFPTASSYSHRGGVRRSYKGEADFFGVYCPQLDKVYFVPVDEVGEVEARLRVEPCKNNQTHRVRLASTYEI